MTLILEFYIGSIDPCVVKNQVQCGFDFIETNSTKVDFI